MKTNECARLLAYVTGLVNQQLLLQNEYLAAENRILRTQLPKRLRLTDSQRCTLAEIGKRLGRKALEQVAWVVKPGTILGWFRRLIAQKFDGSRYRPYPGRPRIGRQLSELVVRMARENPDWGYDRIAGAYPSLDRNSRIRPWVTSFAGTGFPRHRDGAGIRPGGTSSQRIWRCWRVPTSSPSKC
jgi:putative transposase